MLAQAKLVFKRFGRPAWAPRRKMLVNCYTHSRGVRRRARQQVGRDPRRHATARIYVAFGAESIALRSFNSSLKARRMTPTLAPVCRPAILGLWWTGTSAAV